MSRKFSSREKALMLVLAVLVLLYGYYLLIQKPVSETMAAAEAAQADAEIQMLVEQAKAENLRAMEDELAALESDPDAARAEMADYNNAQNVVRVLNEALASAESYDLVFSPVTIEGQVASRPINMLFTCGSYAQARDIVAKLYASPYRCTISALTLTAEEESRRLTAGPVSAQMTITFYEYVYEFPSESETAEEAPAA